VAKALTQLDTWPVGMAAAGVVDRAGGQSRTGPVSEPLRWASITKLLTALATLVAVEEGIVSLDDQAGPPTATVRHLLAHASGLPMDGTKPAAAPGTRRIYSNTGFEVLADTVADRAEMDFAAYLAGAVLEPLAMAGTELAGSPAWGAVGPLTDLLALARELLAPTLIAATTLAEATSVAFPHLAGVLPGFGHQDPNGWGLGFELRDHKHPHWTGAANSPATFGHFGRSGGFLWVDPAAQLACASLADRDFGPWAAEAWPRLSDAVIAEFAQSGESGESGAGR
jgi:CubicO group peptidase (beta-lactamase class C family)